jgi:mannose-6-phosphate isomerase-like protein (cupin superfamily)
MRMTIAFLAMCASAVLNAGAQAPSVDHLTPSELLDKAQALEAKAQSSDGSASAKLTDYPNHYTMIALRHKDGGAEIHQDFSDLFFVVKGKATLLTGGDVQNGKTVSPGEIRGTSLKSGTSTPLNEGDFVHIPAGVSHQLLVAEGGTFIYFVVKVKER